ncbi:teichoic acid D-Ala incorporation-associated protein DltX [uncultured Limosilactobacillus sp.]|nr:teichoic acid D-Ala incorporation-associated protein DltX [uncultured Limosilactobacillus sp.]
MLAALKRHPVAGFLLKAFFYFIVLMLLIYLYGYYGAGQAPFIYNEF